MLDDYGIAADIAAGRLALRPPRPSDAGPLALWLGDARVATMLPAIPHPYPPGAAEALIERARAGLRSGPLYVMDASPSDGPEVVGLVFVNRAREDGAFSVAFAVGPPFWNTGYATEAVQAVAGALFAAGAKAIAASVFQDNGISARVLTRAGFAYVGEGEEFCTGRGATHPVWRYRLDRPEEAAT